MRSLFFSLTLAGFFLLHDASAQTELAKVNGKTITLEYFEKKYQESASLYGSAPITKRAFLDELIRREIGIQMAKKQKLDQDPWVQDRMNTILFQSFIERSLGKEMEKIHVSSDEAENYYKKNPEIRTSHIFYPLAPGASSEEETKGREFLSKIQKEHLASQKMSFAEAAQKFSQGPSAPVGGDLDYKGRGDLDSIYYETALALKTPGKISPIVRSRWGLHLIKLTAIRRMEEANLAKIKQVLIQDKQRALYEAFISDLKTRSQVLVNTSLLKE